MRADMHKVFSERSFGRSLYNKPCRENNIPIEDRPHKEGIRYHLHGKGYDKLTGPLRRWLRSFSGKSWNDAYQEFCRVTDPRHAVQRRMKEHLLETVERHTFMKDGEVYCRNYSHFGQKGEIPINEARNYQREFYVHPETGALWEIPHSKRKESWKPKEVDLAAVMRKLSDKKYLLKIEGYWYACDMQPIDRFGVPMYDHAIGAWLGASHAKDIYNDYPNARVCVRKQRLSRKELSRSGLVNTPGEPDSGLQSTLRGWLVQTIKNHNELTLKRQPRGRIFRSITTLAFGVHTFSMTIFRRVAGLGYRLIIARSPVRVRPLAPDARVAQW